MRMTNVSMSYAKGVRYLSASRHTSIWLSYTSICGRITVATGDCNNLFVDFEGRRSL